MKLYLILLAMVLPTMGCAQRTADISKIKSVNYNAGTRGFYINIEINEENIIVERSREGDNSINKPFTDEKWQRIVTLISEFDVRKLNSMASPSTKSQVDAAAIAHLEIETGNHRYSCSFDHGNPPQPLKRLVAYMLTLSESIE
ncbi:hypothetical protein [Sediminicola sp. 1XM1-17]|uniref:hypothetical protein n=1 Tax=Sediminicola sp. 1XM1-17 TaxID=3127702 RepID=UPI003076A5DF